jgi:hypothetical protein
MIVVLPSRLPPAIVEGARPKTNSPHSARYAGLRRLIPGETDRNMTIREGQPTAAPRCAAGRLLRLRGPSKYHGAGPGRLKLTSSWPSELRILRGAKSTDLPVEPELIINLKNCQGGRTHRAADATRTC